MIQPEHYDDVIKHLRSNFFSDETLNSSMDLCKPGEAHELLEKHSLDTLKDNVSIMAYDKNKQVSYRRGGGPHLMLFKSYPVFLTLKEP